MTPRTIDELWQEYAKAALPLNATQGQRVTMQCTFIAGAFSMLSEMATALATLPEDQGVKRITEYFDECKEFSKAIRPLPKTQN